MAKIKVTRLSKEGKGMPAVFKELDTVMHELRARAYDLFAGRGYQQGHELEDWFRAEREFGLPTTEMVETDAAYEVRVALPGFAADDVKLMATPQRVIVKAKRKKKSASKDKKKDWHSGFTSRALYRQIDFPGTIDAKAVTASLKRGLLKLSAPKASQAAKRDRRIPVSTPAQ